MREAVWTRRIHADGKLGVDSEGVVGGRAAYTKVGTFGLDCDD